MKNKYPCQYNTQDLTGQDTFFIPRRGWRCCFCKRFWRRGFHRFGRGLRRRFRGGRNNENISS